jgi:hypothetical protein
VGFGRDEGEGKTAQNVAVGPPSATESCGEVRADSDGSSQPASEPYQQVPTLSTRQCVHTSHRGPTWWLRQYMNGCPSELALPPTHTPSLRHSSRFSDPVPLRQMPGSSGTVAIVRPVARHSEISHKGGRRPTPAPHASAPTQQSSMPLAQQQGSGHYPPTHPPAWLALQSMNSGSQAWQGSFDSRVSVSPPLWRRRRAHTDTDWPRRPPPQTSSSCCRCRHMECTPATQMRR